MATIRKKGHAQWHVQIRKKGYTPVTKTFNTRADAELWAKTTESEMGRGLFVNRTEAESTTLLDALKRYKDEISIKKKSYLKEVVFINRWIGVNNKGDQLTPEPLTQRALASLRSTDFVKWRNNRLKTSNASPTSLQRELAIISHLFTTCNETWGIPVLNPLANVSKPKADNARNRRLEDDEETRLLEALGGSSNKWLRPLAELAIETAMRQSELLKIEWKDVKTFGIHLKETKNGKPRDVPLSPKARTLLDSMPRSIGGSVFPTTQSAVVQAWSRACKRAGIEDLHFHDLRHEATSRLAQKLPMQDLMKVTGHSSSTMLARYYHPRVEELARKLA